MYYAANQHHTTRHTSTKKQQHNTIQHHIPAQKQYRTQHCTTQHNIKHNTALSYTILKYSIWHNSILLHTTLQFSAVQCITLHDTSQHTLSAVWKYFFTYIHQAIIEHEVEKRGAPGGGNRKIYRPPNGHRLRLFIDDVSSPDGDHGVDQPILELLRQLAERKTVCALEREKRGEMKVFENVQYVTSMSHLSEGKRNENMTKRFLRHFFIYNVLPISVSIVHDIYSPLLHGRFPSASTAMQSVVDCLPYFTEKLFTWLRLHMLPSPCRWHYTFSMGDLSRIFQGILKPNSLFEESSRSLLILWQHECERVYCDRLVNADDKKMFADQLADCTREMLLLLISSTPLSSSLFSSQRCSGGSLIVDAVRSSTSPPLSLSQISSAPSVLSVRPVRSVPKQNKRNFSVRTTVTDSDILPSMAELALQNKVRKRKRKRKRERGSRVIGTLLRTLDFLTIILFLHKSVCSQFFCLDYAQLHFFLLQWISDLFCRLITKWWARYRGYCNCCCPLCLSERRTFVWHALEVDFATQEAQYRQSIQTAEYCSFWWCCKAYSSHSPMLRYEQRKHGAHGHWWNRQEKFDKISLILYGIQNNWSTDDQHIFNDQSPPRY